MKVKVGIPVVFDQKIQQIHQEVEVWDGDVILDVTSTPCEVELKKGEYLVVMDAEGDTTAVITSLGEGSMLVQLGRASWTEQLTEAERARFERGESR